MSSLKTRIQALDSRSKILAVVISLFLLIFSRSGSIWLHAANALPAAVLLGLVTHKPWRVIVRFRYLSGFLILAVFINLSLFMVVPSLKNAGFKAFTYILSTSFCGISFGACLSTTTSAADFAQGLWRLGFPARAVWMMTLAYRFLPLMRDEVQNTHAAAVLRGFRLCSRKGRDFASLTAGMTQRAYELAIHTGDAMYLRGFDLNRHPTDKGILTWRDYTFLLGLPFVYLIIRLGFS